MYDYVYECVLCLLVFDYTFLFKNIVITNWKGQKCAGVSYTEHINSENTLKLIINNVNMRTVLLK